MTLQGEDESLRRALESAQQKTDPQYKISNGFLYRIKTNRRGQSKKQLALPTKFRQRVPTLAHAGVMSGHQGSHRAHERVVASFWWPDIYGNITRFCHSCDVCQRTISKGRPPRNNNKRRQPNLNLREPSPKSATVQPKLKLLPRTVKDPVNTVMHTERNSSIFDTGKTS